MCMRGCVRARIVCMFVIMEVFLSFTQEKFALVTLEHCPRVRQTVRPVLNTSYVARNSLVVKAKNGPCMTPAIEQRKARPHTAP